MRKSFLVLFLLLVTSSVSAYTFTAFPAERTKSISSLSTSLGLRVINMGDTPLQLRFSSQDSDAYNVSLPENTLLEPSEPRTDPPGSGEWYHIGGGRYVRVKKFTFDVEISEYRDSNTVKVPLTVSVRPASVTSGLSTGVLSQQRSFTYVLNIDPALRPLEREERGPDYWREGETSGSAQKREGESGERRGKEAEVNVSEDYKAEEVKKETGERGQINPVTFLLILGTVGSLVYLLKVI